MDVSTQLAAFNAQYAAVTPQKQIPLSLSLSTLSALDINPLPPLSQQSLTTIATEGSQILINALFSLPTTRVEDAVLVSLPREYLMPRAKPVPRVRAKTRWEVFAATKGIQKRTKSRVQYNEEEGEYKAVFGYKGQEVMQDGGKFL